MDGGSNERIEIAKVINETVPDTVNELDKFGKNILSFINEVVMFHPNILSYKFKNKYDEFVKDFVKKYNDIPDQHRQAAPYQIAGPMVEQLKYTIDTDALRAIYISLLTASMDNRMANKVHRAYIDIVGQMVPDEIKIIDCLPDLHRHEPVIDIIIEYPDREGYFTIKKNIGTIAEEAICDFPENLSIYIDNLQRLGLMEVKEVSLAEEWRYDKILKNSIVSNIIDEAKKSGQTQIIYKSVGITDLGDNLRQICNR